MQDVKRYPFFFCLFFLTCTFLYADESDGDDFFPTMFPSTPSQLVEGRVSVITGQVHTAEETLVIAGAEPIRIPQINGQVLPHRTAYCELSTWGQICSAEIFSPNGCHYQYYPSGRTLEKDGKKWIKLRPNNLGSSSEHIVSSRSAHKDTYILIDEDKKYLCYFGADQTRKIYKRIKEKKHSNCFRLQVETLSNGNHIVYQYDSQHRISSISSTNPSKKAIYASARFHYRPPLPTCKGKMVNYEIHGSDGQIVQYRHEGRFVSKISRDKINLHYHYCTFPWQRPRIDKAVLHQISSHQSRFVGFSYHNPVSPDSDPIRGFVSSIQSPVGEDATPYTTSTFIYSPKENKTTVFDIDQNRTEYSWRGSFLNKISRYRSDGKLIGSERFDWDFFTNRKSFFTSAVLLTSELLDENHRPIKSRKFTYDEKGNLKTEKLVGNLSGGESTEEEYVLTHHYNKEQLIERTEEPNGRRVLYEYVPGTELLRAKFISDQGQIKRRIFWEYTGSTPMAPKGD